MEVTAGNIIGIVGALVVVVAVVAFVNLAFAIMGSPRRWR